MIFAIYYAPIRHHEKWEEEPVDIFLSQKDALDHSKTLPQKEGMIIKIRKENL